MIKTQPTPYKYSVEQDASSRPHPYLFSLCILLAMLAAIFFVGAVLPLRTLSFYSTFPITGQDTWLFFPTHLLFPGKPVILPYSLAHAPAPGSVSTSWQQTFLLFSGFTLLFASYLLALRYLANRVTYRFILLSTCLLGLICTFIPAATSQDLYSYIAYARMGVIYHLNPLTTIPTAIRTDPIYKYIFWTHQPSAYGPTWAIITCTLQAFSNLLDPQRIAPMILLLRLFGLAMHLGSVGLIWLISGRLQRSYSFLSPQIRLTAMLAFAWNPLLIFEACVNAHNDTTILFLILLAIWFLLPYTESGGYTDTLHHPYILAAIFLALAACLKITLVVLAPGLLLFLWTQQKQRLQRVFIAALIYAGIIFLLYAPFWQHGAILHLLQINPGTTRDINSPHEFLLRLAESLQRTSLPYVSTDRGSALEVLSHQISLAIFAIFYGALCLWSLRNQQYINTLPALIRWMLVVWFLYCFVASPWFWPWYMTTFYAFFALIEATSTRQSPVWRILNLPFSIRLLTFSLLCSYCFFTWGPHVSLIPGLYSFQWAYVRGLWIWLIPLLAIIPSVWRWYRSRTSKPPDWTP